MNPRKPSDYKGNRSMIMKIFECGEAAREANVHRKHEAVFFGGAKGAEKRAEAQAKRERKNAKRAALLRGQE